LVFILSPTQQNNNMNMGSMFNSAKSLSQDLCWDLNPNVDRNNAVVFTDGATLNDVESSKCGGPGLGSDDDHGTVSDSAAVGVAAGAVLGTIVVDGGLAYLYSVSYKTARRTSRVATPPIIWRTETVEGNP